MDTFYPLQIGICFFKWSRKRQSWTCKPFNFYLRPYTHKYLQSQITFNSSTISFLHENHFDFNKSLSSGIYTLRYSDEREILRLIREESEQQEYKDDNEYRFIQEFLSTVNDWVLKTKEESLRTIQEDEDKQQEDCDELFSPHASHQPHVEVEGVDYIFTPPCSFHTRKLIQQEIESQYPKLFVCERPEDNAGVKSKYHRWRIYRHQYTRDPASIPQKTSLVKMPSASLHSNYQQGTALEKDPGMRRVLELMIASKKPLVGFECLLDITFTFGSMYDYLQEQLADFIPFLHERIPTLVDLKVILKEPAMKAIFTEISSLVNAFHIVSTEKTFENPPIGMYNDSATVLPHDASNDAYMTGYVYIKLATFYGLSFQDIRNTMRRVEQGCGGEVLYEPSYSTHLPSNYDEVPVQPDVFTASYNHINLHQFNDSIPLYIEEYKQVSEKFDRRSVLLLSNIPNYYNRDLMRKLFAANGIQYAKNILFEWLSPQYALATFPSINMARETYSLWKTCRTNPDVVSPTKNFTFDQLEMNDYSVYEKMCNVPSNIIESHKSAFKMD